MSECTCKINYNSLEPCDPAIIYCPLHAAAGELAEACRKAVQLAEIARDWNLDEVEIDGHMVLTLDLVKEFRAALAKARIP